MTASKAQTTPAEAVPARPDDVVGALAAVMGELGGIGRMTAEERRQRGLVTGDQGVSYAYRGIDQIAAAVQPLFAKYGIVAVPFVVASEVKDIIVNTRPWTDTFVRVEWVIAGPNGTQLRACTEGWGRDNSDKGANKAITGAFKNLLLRLLCIGDPADDTDGTTHERDAAVEPEPPDPADVLFERVRGLAGTPVADELKTLAAESNRRLSANAFRDDRTWAELVEAHIAAAETATDEPTQQEASDG